MKHPTIKEVCALAGMEQKKLKTQFVRYSDGLKTAKGRWICTRLLEAGVPVYAHLRIEEGLWVAPVNLWQGHFSHTRAMSSLLVGTSAFFRLRPGFMTTRAHRGTIETICTSPESVDLYTPSAEEWDKLLNLRNPVPKMRRSTVIPQYLIEGAQFRVEFSGTRLVKSVFPQ